MLGIILTLIAGLFFLSGALITVFTKRNQKVLNFSIGMAFIVLILILILDIIPEVWEIFSNKFNILIGIIIGILILLLIEKIVPHHNHFEEKHQHERHLNHIGIMTSIAIIIHNIVEGIGISTIADNGFKIGLIYTIGVGLHNIPFGIEIATMFDEKNKKRKWILIMILSLSTMLGGLIIHIFGNLISEIFLGYLLSITIGMIIYLLFGELFIELKENFNKYSIYGIITGILFIIIGVFI